jgi:hypothetical protein
MTLAGCSRMNSVDQDRSSGKIVGKITTIDGAPVRNATVKMTPSDFSPDQAKNIDSVLFTTTDGIGQYSFSVEKSGIYSINAEKNGLYSYQDSVYGSEGKLIEAGTSTLKAPGSISGTARLNNPDDNRSIIILVLGTTTYCQPSDTTGAFVINNLAEGEYRLKLLSSKRGYNVLDTTVQVVEGKNTHIGDTLQLVRCGLPGVGPVRAEFNKAMQIVTLTWPSVDTTDVQCLYVFRNTTLAEKPYLILKKTTNKLIDDIPDSSMVGDTLSYSIVTCGTDNKIGPVSVASKIRIDGVFSLVKTIPLNILSDFPNSYFTSLAVDKNLNVFIPDDGKVVKLDSNGNVIARYFDGHVSDVKLYQSSLTLDKAGNCYFLNPRTSSLIKFSNKLEIQKSHSYTIELSSNIVTYVNNEVFYVANISPLDSNLIRIFNSDLEFVESISLIRPDRFLFLHNIHSGKFIFEPWIKNPTPDHKGGIVFCTSEEKLNTVDTINLSGMILQYDSLIKSNLSEFSECNFSLWKRPLVFSQVFSLDNGSMAFFDNYANAYVVNKEKCLMGRFKLLKCMRNYYRSIAFCEKDRLCYYGDKKRVQVYEIR